MIKLWHSICCWFGCHTWDWENSDVIYEDLGNGVHWQEEQPYSHYPRIRIAHELVWCRYCGDGPYRIY